MRHLILITLPFHFHSTQKQYFSYIILEKKWWKVLQKVLQETCHSDPLHFFFAIILDYYENQKDGCAEMERVREPSTRPLSAMFYSQAHVHVHGGIPKFVIIRDKYFLVIVTK